MKLDAYSKAANDTPSWVIKKMSTNQTGKSNIDAQVEILNPIKYSLHVILWVSYLNQFQISSLFLDC